MKKLIPIILVSIMLLCSCQTVDESDNRIDFSSFSFESMKDYYGVPDEHNEDCYIYNDVRMYGYWCTAKFYFNSDEFQQAKYCYSEMSDNQFESLKQVIRDKYGHNYTESEIYMTLKNYDYGLEISLTKYDKMLRIKKVAPKSTTTTAPETTVNKATLPKDYYETKSTTKSADSYEWTINTNSDGYDWNSVNDMEKDVWCSNSFAAWRLMGYDIPNDASQSELKRMIDAFYADEENCKVDITTVTESYAILKGIY